MSLNELERLDYVIPSNLFVRVFFFHRALQQISSSNENGCFLNALGVCNRFNSEEISCSQSTEESLFSNVL